DRVARRQPENEVVVLAARVRVDAERPRSGPVEVPFAFARAQPGEILALHAADPVGADAELLDPVLPRVRGRRVHRKAEGARVALVVGRRQDDGGGTHAQLLGNRERVEQDDVVAELDRVRRDELGPRLLRVPVGMRRSPVPDAGAQLVHRPRIVPAAGARRGRPCDLAQDRGAAAPGRMSPDSYAKTTAWIRSRQLIFESTLATCDLTVDGSTTSSAAISAFERPRASRTRTSRSRAVSSPRDGASVGGWTNCSRSLRVLNGASRASPAITVRTAATS